MPGVVEPETGLVFYELSHEWGHDVPMQPGFDEVRVYRSSTHAKNGVMAQRIRMVMHSGTHVNAPRHMIQTGIGVGEIALDRFFGSGVVVRIPKQRWELVTAADLEAATPAIEPEDIVVIDTGWHAKFSDSIEYFGRSPGLSKDAAEWLVKKGVKLVAVDTPQVDHPLATSLGPHRNGPQMKRIAREYEVATGRSALGDFPEWNAAHRVLLAAGIPTIENAGGDLSEVSGKRCTFHAMPWNFEGGDACAIRFVAILDPAGSFRLAAGA
ncbi:MAG: cyclase family protein [Devosia nanyangense]|uniref:Cyclase family protein n=1 Tax=Devosia nanyangense TaxID=1228055 RepID=A0A933L1G3_9HYPH|nr:cyclase family protein [Devosia nanyangense]